MVYILYKSLIFLFLHLFHIVNTAVFVRLND